jgi:hypothetical protein
MKQRTAMSHKQAKNARARERKEAIEREERERREAIEREERRPWDEAWAELLEEQRVWRNAMQDRPSTAYEGAW